MKIPKYSCSACGKPSSRKWNLDRHISNCHAGIGNCVSFVTVVNGNKGYFVDYAASIDKFSKYLSIAQGIVTKPSAKFVKPMKALRPY